VCREAPTALVDLIALVFRVADGDAQQRLRIEELEKAGGKSVGGIVDIGRPDGSVGANQAKIAIGPLSLGAIQGAGETLYVGTFQAGGRRSMRRFGRIRGDAQVVVMGRAQRFGYFVERFRFHRVPFNASVR
jgi:hypothetical protein